MRVISNNQFYIFPKLNFFALSFTKPYFLLEACPLEVEKEIVGELS